MKMSIAQFRNDMATPINQVNFGGQRVVLTRKGKAAAALVSMADFEYLEKLEDEFDVKAARKVLAEMKRKGEKPIPWEKVRAKLGL